MKKNDVRTDEKALSTKEVAEILSCSEKYVRQLMKSKDFPLLKLGKNFKVRKSELDKWIEKQENKSITERC